MTTATKKLISFFAVSCQTIISQVTTELKTRNTHVYKLTHSQARTFIHPHAHGHKHTHCNQNNHNSDADLNKLEGVVPNQERKRQGHGDSNTLPDRAENRAGVSMEKQFPTQGWGTNAVPPTVFLPLLVRHVVTCTQPVGINTDHSKPRSGSHLHTAGRH